MTTIAVLTPDADDATFAHSWPGALERLGAALAREGIDVAAVPWTAHVDDVDGLRAYPLVLPLLAWGYHLDPVRWQQACATWARRALPLGNPASVLAWNSDKRYLAGLAARGIATPETAWVDAVTQDDVDAMFEATGAARLIVKPVVSAGAWKTLRLERGERLADAPPGAAMIQPYLPAIEHAGETSMLFFEGRLGHVVRKTPRAGDFRIQMQFGGTYTLVAQPPAAALALARDVLAAIDEPLLYARVDAVPDDAGRWRLMEVELIEPDLYLGIDAGRGAGFAAAVRSRLERA